MHPFTLEELRKSPVEHFLGYHTKDTMSYDFDEAEQFTLVTSNEDEAHEVSYRKDPTKNGFVWVIEGRKEKGKAKTQYYLREVFRPTKKCEKSEESHYSGAKKKFDHTLEGEGIEVEVRLNDEPWFEDFKKRNGNFGFGLRALHDEKTKAEFLRLVSTYFGRIFVALAPTQIQIPQEF